MYRTYELPGNSAVFARFALTNTPQPVTFHAAETDEDGTPAVMTMEQFLRLNKRTGEGYGMAYEYATLAVNRIQDNLQSATPSEGDRVVFTGPVGAYFAQAIIETAFDGTLHIRLGLDTPLMLDLYDDGTYILSHPSASAIPHSVVTCKANWLQPTEYVDSQTFAMYDGLLIQTQVRVWTFALNPSTNN